MSLMCPKCEIEALSSTRIKNVEVDQCKRCHGIWFDERELSELLQERPKDLRPLTKSGGKEELNEKSGKCPRDGAELLRVYSSLNRSIVLDHCPECHGTWLDGGELAELMS